MAGLVTKQEPGKVGISQQARAIRDAKLGGYWDGWAAFVLTGARSGTSTGFGAWAQDGVVDIFAKASTYERPGQNPYNTFLTADSKPQFPLYPEVAGLYLGSGLASINGADPNELQQVAAMILEHSTLEINGKTYGNACFQTGMQMLPGIGLPTYTTDSFRYFEQHGAMTKSEMFRLPPECAFSTSEKIEALLNIDKPARDALAALAGNFPAAGAIIAVRMVGTAEYQVQGGRGR